jgi:aspartate carbamoyltransferase catalytic subunit
MLDRSADHVSHLISVQDFTRQDIVDFFETAEMLADLPADERRLLLQGRLIAPLFFQPSTRTRLGFESAALRLGGTVSGFADPSMSRSVDYIGESLEDTIRVVAEFSDVIVLRHFLAGAARQAAAVSRIPVVNGGDGSNEHPTQALSDAWTMTRTLGDLSGAVIGVVGDPGTRVHRSLVQVLSRLAVSKLLFLVPPAAPIELRVDSGVIHRTLPTDLRSVLNRAGVGYEFRSDVRDLLVEADAIEMMPVSIPGLEADPRSLAKTENVTPEQYRITASKIRETASRALVLHPGPRSEEMHADVDLLPNGLFFDQVRDSLLMRMAALTRVSGVAISSELHLPAVANAS